VSRGGCQCCHCQAAASRVAARRRFLELEVGGMVEGERRRQASELIRRAKMRQTVGIVVGALCLAALIALAAGCAPAVRIPEEVKLQLQDLIAKRALFAVSHSGGKDSQAMLIQLLKIIPREQLLVVHASLGEVEWEGALELAEKQAADAGLPFIVATAVKTFLEMVEHRFKVRPGPNSPCWPSASTASAPATSSAARSSARCAATRRRTASRRRELRRDPRPGERRRARSRSPSDQRAQQVAGRDWFDWLPIHELSVAQVFAEIAGAGQEPHWAYAAGNERLSCVFCIMGSRATWRTARSTAPSSWPSTSRSSSAPATRCT
jgi:3'-phosphoadenosine 5'-phosphosulfate sulfotransferase (PAPS reductase)/FAD synthetase